MKAEWGSSRIVPSHWMKQGVHLNLLLLDGLNQKLQNYSMDRNPSRCVQAVSLVSYRVTWILFDQLKMGRKRFLEYLDSRNKILSQIISRIKVEYNVKYQVSNRKLVGP